MAYIAPEGNQDEDKKQGKDFVPNSNYQASVPASASTGAGGSVSPSQNNKPLNQNYQIMRGITGGNQSNAISDQTIGQVNQGGENEVGNLQGQAADFSKNNSVDRDVDMSKGYNDWLNDSTSDNGTKFAQIMGRNPATPIANNYTASANYQSQYQPNQRHDNTGIAALDQATQSPQQRAVVGSAVANQNQNIGDLVSQQNSATGGITAQVNAGNKNAIEQQQKRGSGLIDTDITNTTSAADLAAKTLKQNNYNKSATDLAAQRQLEYNQHLAANREIDAANTHPENKSKANWDYQQQLYNQMKTNNDLKQKQMGDAYNADTSYDQKTTDKLAKINAFKALIGKGA